DPKRHGAPTGHSRPYDHRADDDLDRARRRLDTGRRRQSAFGATDRLGRGDAGRRGDGCCPDAALERGHQHRGRGRANGVPDGRQSIAAIHTALEQGVNWIDTAAAYGFGHSEEIVGAALDGLAERPYVFTKWSLLEGPGRTVVHSLKRDSVLQEAEASLKRLRVDAIDLYQVHWPDPEADIEEGWAALAELKEQGVVRHIGVSNFDVEQLRRVQQIAPDE